MMTNRVRWTPTAVADVLSQTSSWRAHAATGFLPASLRHAPSFEELQQGQRGQAERESGFLDCQAWQETALLRWIKPSRRDADGLLALRLVGLSRRDRRLRRRETFGADSRNSVSAETRPCARIKRQSQRTSCPRISTTASSAPVNELLSPRESPT